MQFWLLIILQSNKVTYDSFARESSHNSKVHMSTGLIGVLTYFWIKGLEAAVKVHNLHGLSKLNTV